MTRACARFRFLRTADVCCCASLHRRTQGGEVWGMGTPVLHIVFCFSCVDRWVFRSGACFAFLGLQQSTTTWSCSHVPPPCNLPGGCSAGNLTFYSARLGNAQSLLARLDDAGLFHVTNGAGVLSEPRRKPHNDGPIQYIFGTTTAPPRPSAVTSRLKTTGHL